MFEWGFGMTVGVLSFVKLKVRGVLAVFIFIFSPLWRASPFCLPELRSGQARPARHEAASAPASRPATQTLSFLKEMKKINRSNLEQNKGLLPESRMSDLFKYVECGSCDLKLVNLAFCFFFICLFLSGGNLFAIPVYRNYKKCATSS